MILKFTATCYNVCVCYNKLTNLTDYLTTILQNALIINHKEENFNYFQHQKVKRISFFVIIFTIHGNRITLKQSCNTFELLVLN